MRTGDFRNHVSILQSCQWAAPRSMKINQRENTDTNAISADILEEPGLTNPLFRIGASSCHWQLEDHLPLCPQWILSQFRMAVDSLSQMG